MFKISKGETVSVYAPFGKLNGIDQVTTHDGTRLTDASPWKPFVCRRDTILDKQHVYDYVALYNQRSDTFEWPQWIKDCIKAGYTVIKYKSCWAMKLGQLEYLD
jgi:hypothetical protein